MLFELIESGNVAQVIDGTCSFIQAAVATACVGEGHSRKKAVEWLEPRSLRGRGAQFI